MSEHKTYRINVTLRGELSHLFEDRLKAIRIEEINAGAQVVMSASELARDLIGKAISIPSDQGILFTERIIGYEESRGLFYVRFNPSDADRLRSEGIPIEKGAKLDIVINHKTQGTNS